MTENQGPDGPSRDLRERIGAYFTWAAPEVGEEFGEYPTWDQLTEQDQAYGLARADAILTEIAAAEYVIVRERAIGDALSDAIMEATNHGWNDPDSAIWRRGMAAGHRTLGLAYPVEPEAGR